MERIKIADENDIRLVQFSKGLALFEIFVVDQCFIVAGPSSKDQFFFITALHFDIVNMALIILDIHVQPDSPGKESDIDGFFKAGIGDFLYPDAKDCLDQLFAEPFIPHDPFK